MSECGRESRKVLSEIGSLGCADEISMLLPPPGEREIELDNR